MGADLWFLERQEQYCGRGTTNDTKNTNEDRDLKDMLP